MPCANCYACLVTNQTLQQPKGSLNEAIGCCRNCNSLICGHHGHRDPNVPEFICVLCDPSLLVASAVTLGAPNNKKLANLKNLYHSQDIPKELWIINSLEDFERRRPNYGKDFFEHVSKMAIVKINIDFFMSEELQLIKTIIKKKTQLIAAAFHIIETFQISEDIVPGPIIDIFKYITWSE